MNHDRSNLDRVLGGARTIAFLARRIDDIAQSCGDVGLDVLATKLGDIRTMMLLVASDIRECHGEGVIDRASAATEATTNMVRAALAASTQN